MAKFLRTTGVSYRLEEIIRSASERLVIISPYLRINLRLRELLEDKDRLKIDVRVVYGKKELRTDEEKWLESMQFIRTSFCENLHAKCFLNEEEALLTSMNLYEFSQVNNYEMGISVSRIEDPELYRDIFEESMRIVRISNETGLSFTNAKATQQASGRTHTNRTSEGRKSARKSSSSNISRSTPVKPQNGFCIRCKTKTVANPRQPYCKRCFQSWNRYQNKSHEEGYCHTCGDKHTATLLRPLCPGCYGKYSDVFKFAGN